MASWYHWKSLCKHFQKLVYVSPGYSTWQNYEVYTGDTSNFSVPIFAFEQIIEPQHCQDDSFGSFFPTN